MSDQPPAQGKHPGARTALALLLAINLFNYIDRQILPAVLTPIKAAFNIPRDQAGLLQSAFLYAYMVGAPLLGSLATRWSRWWIIGLSVAIWSLASGASGLASSFAFLLVARILVGIGEAGYGPSAPALISDYFSPEKRGKVMALFYLAIPVGSALGYVIGGHMNSLFSSWGANSWRAPFFVVVIPGLILSALCFLRKEPRPAVVAAAEKRSFIADALAVFKIRSFILNTLAMTAMTFAIGGIAFWVPDYIVGRIAADQGLTPYIAMEHLNQNSPERSKWLMSQLNDILEKANTKFGVIVVLAGIISTFVGGWLADKLRERWKGAYFLTSGGAILFAFPCTLAMLKLPFPYAWYAVFGAVFFLFFNTGPANTALANVTTPPMRATAFAVNIFIIHALGDAISPPLIGWVQVTTGSWDTAFVLVSLTMIIASALWLIGAKYLPHDEAAATAASATLADEKSKHSATE